MMCTKHFGFLAYRGQDARGRQPRNFWVINHLYHGTISQSREILIIVISLSGLVLTRMPPEYHRRLIRLRPRRVGKRP